MVRFRRAGRGMERFVLFKFYPVSEKFFRDRVGLEECRVIKGAPNVSSRWIFPPPPLPVPREIYGFIEGSLVA